MYGSNSDLHLLEKSALQNCKSLFWVSSFLRKKYPEIIKNQGPAQEVKPFIIKLDTAPKDGL